MKKIFFIMLMLVFISTPFTNVLAAEGGYFHGQTIKTFTNAPFTVVTDGNTSTDTNVRNSTGAPVFEFSEPQKVTKYYMYGSSCISFYSDIARTKKIHEIPRHSKTGWTDINIENVMSITASTCGQSVNVYLAEMDFIVFEPINYVPVTFLQQTHTHNSINLTWTNPSESQFSEVVITQNGIEIAQLDNTANSFSITDLQPLTTYNLEVFAKYLDGTISTGQKVTVTTNEAPVIPDPTPIGEVINLTATATHDKVNLSWSLPVSDKLQHVNIYRDTVTETSLLDTLLGTSRAYAAATKIFETNGTYFNDLTVDEKTTYEYTLTTISTEGLESEGVTEQITTPEKPIPEIVGGGYEKDPATGDFIYYWTEPTEGEVKILVGGVQYKVVAAAAKQILIPASDMKYTAFGDPNVTLIPIDSDGEEGAPVKPPLNGEGSPDSISNVDVPFSATDLLKSGMGLFIVIAPFVLLALSFLLVPKLRFLLVQAFTKKELREERKRRFESETRERKERQQRERTERTEREKSERTERKERLHFTEKTIGSKGSRESVIVKAERVPTERREREARQERNGRAEKERVTRERTPRTERGFR